MKKIGVVTYYRSKNYGAFLQSFALQSVLNKMGYSSSIIKYVPNADIERYKLFSIKRPRNTIRNILRLRTSVLRKHNFEKQLGVLDEIPSTEKLDVAITGSDQVWNPALSGNVLDPVFTLKQINSAKKISYAASIGNEAVVQNNNYDFSDLAELDHISVREDSAKKALSRVIKNKINVVVDPTALLTRNDWLKVLKDEPVDSNNYIFSYFIGIRNDQAEALSRICENLNLKTVSYSLKPVEKHIYKKCYSDGPFRFLARLRDSKLVITSSFHGTILSIIFHKNFYVLMPDSKKRSRMDNILKLTGLTGRIIETEADIDKINLEDIDYTEPQKKLDKLRQESLDWLKNAIEN